METLVAAQNQSSNNSQDPLQRTIISENVSMLIPVAPVNDQQYHMPPGFPWGIPHVVTVVMFVPPLVVHTIPYNKENIYHAAPSKVVGVNERLEGFQDQFLEMKREINSLRGKDLFGKTAFELCLVPNVQIPPKFKVPDFEKYKGKSCPQSHLVMYARNMSTQTDNHQLLINYFQDSLTSAALKWYMGLDNAKIRTFNELGEAFICQYKYNIDMAPDKDQLCAMSKKDKESFKEYAKSAPSDFTEMVNMGMRLEEAVQEGRLTKEVGASSHVKKFANNFSKKKESDVSVVSYGRQRRKYQHVASVSLIINAQMVAPIYQQ
ncbi:uncharacterized protein LOC127132013 [Lathyrus oleraceus]|uniref:uncharacterized protein LOC127132013 n=1 Tax=Pisum sativum TaxID=3888 RepID=UPI0021CFF525|nr:uncharacterized protein LOC127132013 [Pisum sativum]